MKSLIRKITPAFLIIFYHFILAKTAAFFYGYPSRNMIVVGITGTGGKSSTVYLLAKLLEAAGLKVGVTSTIFFKIGGWEKLNDKKMTMLGRFATQKFLRRMARANCQIAIIETTSQGIEQFRHLNIDYDIIVLTNLYPEHIEAHAGFANYQAAKGKLFAALSKTYHKKFAPPKTIIVNGDDEHAQYFLNFWAEKKIVFGLNKKEYFGAVGTVGAAGAVGAVDAEAIAVGVENIIAENPREEGTGISFKVTGEEFSLSLLGKFNIYNSLAAISAALSIGLPISKIKFASSAMKNIPGRQEFIEAGQNFKVLVDYAFEPKAMAGLYETIKKIPHQKIIHVLGSTGGGRDKARRPELGRLAGMNADFVFITDEDPYDEDPMEIINQVAKGVEASAIAGAGAAGAGAHTNVVAGAAGKKEGVNLFKILDRREAIDKAIALAKEGDLVLITGKGSEQAMCVAGEKKIPWDDRDVAREAIAKR